MKPQRGSLWVDAVAPAAGERFDALVERPGVRIERILSSSRPDSTPYDQDGDEWVVLLEGAAVLEIAGERVELSAGDWLFIPAHTPHRVLVTAPGPRCLWLAVHLGQDARSSPAGRNCSSR